MIYFRTPETVYLLQTSYTNHNYPFYSPTTSNLFHSLRLMPADLRISVLGRCALLQIHSLEDGVLSVLLLDGKCRLLNFSFPFQRSILRLLLFLLGGVVRKKVQLNGAVVLLRCIRFRQDMICNDLHAPHQEIFVHDPVKQL